MDRNFARALSLVLKHEGGWADHPEDPGGATMKGVTLANFRRYVKPNATKADLRKITDEQISHVYRRFYWEAVSAGELPDGVDYAVFDFAVNSGPGRVAKYLQAVVGVPADGKIGPATLAAVRAKAHAAVIHELCDRRMAFLRGLKTWNTFGTGWTSRVKGVRSEALKLAAPNLGEGITLKPSLPKASSPETPPERITPSLQKPQGSEPAKGLAYWLGLLGSVLRYAFSRNKGH